MTPKLYYRRTSHHCEKIRKILEYKRIPYERVDLKYYDHTPLIALSGQDYVPYLALGESKGVAWREIPEWAESQAPNPSIFPGAATRATCAVFDHWAMSFVEEQAWRYFLPDIAESFEDPVERWAFTELQERGRGSLDKLREDRHRHKPSLDAALQMCEDLLAERAFLLGDRPSLADFSLYGALQPFRIAKTIIPPECRKLRAWHDHVHGI